MLVLEAMAEDPHRAWGVREIASELGWTPSTLHRILVLLDEDRWITSSSEGRYSLGIRFLKMAIKASSGFPLAEIGKARLHDLVADTKETAVLSLYDPARLEMTFVASVDSPQPVRYVADLLDTWGPLHAGATGLAILAFLPEDERRRIVHGELKQVTEATVTDPESLEARLAKIRKDGYVCSTGERTVGAVGIAAPVFGPGGGRVLGDVALTIPESRFEKKELPRLSDAVKRCAASISVAIDGDSHAHAAT